MSDRTDRERYRRRLAGDVDAERILLPAHRMLWLNTITLCLAFEPLPEAGWCPFYLWIGFVLGAPMCCDHSRVSVTEAQHEEH